MEYETIYCYSSKTTLEVLRKISIEGKLVRRLSDEYAVFTVGSGLGSGGAYHRLDGPALINIRYKSIDFYIFDDRYSITEEYCRAAGMSDEDTFMWLLRFGDVLPDTIEGFYGEDWKDMALEEF